jgi:hypothetical protein
VAKQIESFDVDKNQKLAIRALSRDVWSVCEDLRQDPASDDEIVALFAAAIARSKSRADVARLLAEAQRITLL